MKSGRPHCDRMISCLMATGDPSRFGLLQQSVRSFLSQTHREKELVIYSDGPPGYQQALRSYLGTHGNSGIRLEQADVKLSLGTIRNKLVSLARGKFVCQWDDDDISHPKRLLTQLECMTAAGTDACFFQDQLHLFTDSGELFWVDWEPDLIPGTLLCRRGVLLDLPYPEDDPEEDVGIRDKYLDSGGASVLHGLGYLYLYRYTGHNTRTRRHHEMITRYHNGGRKT